MPFKILLVLHLIGSAIWVGGHLILATVILPRALRLRDPEGLHQFESRYEKIGIPALLLQIVSGIWLAYYYVNNLFEVFDFSSAVHTLIAIKLVLLAATVLIAAHARIRLIGKLREDNMNYLAWHIFTITVLAVAMLFFGAGIRAGGWW